MTWSWHLPSGTQQLGRRLASHEMGGEVVEWSHTAGEGATPPPPQTKVTAFRENEIFNRENLIGLFLVHKLLSPRPPPPSLLINGGGCPPPPLSRPFQSP